VHPLAGQGLNLGFGDGRALAETVADAVSAGRDLGSLSVLRGFDEQRRAQVQGMQAALDVIKTLFAAGGDRPGISSAFRTAGMAAVQALEPLKGEMAAFAMGSDSRVAAKVIESVGKYLGTPAISAARFR
jgi:2-polyprenyl-6-methoxyphenol hydroxylase-like FAD-dependent oxidoreductase